MVMSVRMYKFMGAGMAAACVLGFGGAIWSNDSLMGRVQAAQPVVSHTARDLWMDAARMGAPVYRAEGGPVSLPPPPVGKAIVVSGGGYVFASDDVADVVRWYGLLTYPALDLSAFPSVRYVYEVESAELVTEADGRKVLAVSVHEARTGCALPACDPVTQLPNYDRRYVVKPSNAVVSVAGGKHA